MIKNIVLILSIVLLSLAIIFFSYLVKNKELCCRYDLCSKLTNVCVDSPSTLDITSEKGVELALNDLERNDIVMMGDTISGEISGSWYFEGEFPVRVLNEDMEIINTLSARATSDWMTEELVPFEFDLNTLIDEKTNVVLRFERSNPSGLPENDDYIDFPLIIDIKTKTIALEVYFPNEKMGSPEDCSLVFPVIRNVPETQAVGRAALEELFEGATENEKLLGYYTSINDGVVIQSLTISNGVARVDLNSRLEETVGGSCRTISIRKQIEETLKQFSTVSSVIISIDGRVEDILQP